MKGNSAAFHWTDEKTHTGQGWVTCFWSSRQLKLKADLLTPTLVPSMTLHTLWLLVFLGPMGLPAI